VGRAQFVQALHLDRVKAGESIEVTERGTPVAVLVPAARNEVRERLVRDVG
jgi:prevent-host-death family protein